MGPTEDHPSELSMMMPPKMAQSKPPPQMPPREQQQRVGQYGNVETNCTLWIAVLKEWMDEIYLYHCFSQYAEEIVSLRIPRDEDTGEAYGFGLIEFSSHGVAERVLQTCLAATIPNCVHKCLLDWASIGFFEPYIKCKDTETDTDSECFSDHTNDLEYYMRLNMSDTELGVPHVSDTELGVPHVSDTDTDTDAELGAQYLSGMDAGTL